MKKLLLIFCLLLFTDKLFAQEFLQYNTGTLFDSFENPAQRSFIPDSSRKFASNFFIPNFDGNFYLTGDAQQTIKNRFVNDYYINSALQIGGGNHFNRVNGSANYYSLMLKMFSSLNGNEEIGFFIQTRAVTRGTFTDEDVALANGSLDFPGDSYNNVLNSNLSYQSYNQFGFSYREQITRQFAFGIKIASVSGMGDESINITGSSIDFDKAADTATMGLKGINRKAGFSTLPFSNPGLSVSIGSTYKTEDGFVLQGNLKDLGFIHWNKKAEIYDFTGKISIYDLTSPNRENDVYNSFAALISRKKTLGAYNTPLDGIAELSVSKLFWINEDDGIKYSPTLIASKELFYNGFTGAMVNPVWYKNYSLSLVTSYSDMRLFDFGAQFMIKSPNAEFFIGSDRIFQSTNLVSALTKNQKDINAIGEFTGADLILGASFKFGPVIEHPMNASVIPMGDDNKGFLGRLWQRVFNPNKGAIKNN